MPCKQGYRVPVKGYITSGYLIKKEYYCVSYDPLSIQCFQIIYGINRTQKAGPVPHQNATAIFSAKYPLLEQHLISSIMV